MSVRRTVVDRSDRRVEDIKDLIVRQRRILKVLEREGYAELADRARKLLDQMSATLDMLGGDRAG